MLLGPIFEVELITSGRRLRYFVVRVLYALVLGFVFWMNYHVAFQYSTTVKIQQMTRFTAAFFESFAWVQIMVVLILGPAMVAGTIATERERRTIEYLFVTDLKNSEIVVAKLAARLLHLIYLVLVGLPILSLTMLLGGIAPDRLLQSFVISLSTMVAVATMSIAISVGTTRARDAVIRTYICLFALLTLPWLFHLWLVAAEILFFEPFLELFQDANPLYVLGEVTSVNRFTAASSWSTILPLVRNQMIFAAVCAIGATWSVRRVHLAASNTPAGKKKGRRGALRILRPNLGNSPMRWKELFSDRAGVRMGIATRIATTLIVIGFVGTTMWVWSANLSRPSRPNGYLVYVAYMGSLVGCLGLLVVAARAASSVTSEKERDCWDLILSAPMEPKEIVHAKILGSIYSGRGFLFLLGFMWALGTFLEPGFLLVIPFLVCTLVVTAFFVSALGVRLSLSSRNSTRAMAGTIAITIFLGGGYLFFCFPIFPIIFAGLGDEREWMLFALSPCIPFLLVFPDMVYLKGERMFLGEEGIVFFAYLLGMLGYFIAAFVLARNAIANFDTFSGRVVHLSSQNLIVTKPNISGTTVVEYGSSPSDSSQKGSRGKMNDDALPDEGSK